MMLSYRTSYDYQEKSDLALVASRTQGCRKASPPSFAYAATTTAAAMLTTLDSGTHIHLGERQPGEGSNTGKSQGDGSGKSSSHQCIQQAYRDERKSDLALIASPVSLAHAAAAAATAVLTTLDSGTHIHLGERQPGEGSNTGKL